MAPNADVHRHTVSNEHVGFRSDVFARFGPPCVRHLRTDERVESARS